jgi:regulator of replication initiation timing
LFSLKIRKILSLENSTKFYNENVGRLFPTNNQGTIAKKIPQKLDSFEQCIPPFSKKISKMTQSLETLIARKAVLREEMIHYKDRLKRLVNEYTSISETIKDLQQNVELQMLLEKEKTIRPRLQMDLKPKKEDDRPFEVEPNTKIRICDVLVPMEIFKYKLVGREFVFIEEIIPKMIGNDIDGDWTTIAVIYHISKRFENKLGQKIQCFDCADLRGYFFRLFVVDSLLDQCSNGSVIAILNCQIIKPSEV